jgi:hypothetical protein
VGVFVVAPTGVLALESGWCAGIPSEISILWRDAVIVVRFAAEEPAV